MSTTTSPLSTLAQLADLGYSYQNQDPSVGAVTSGNPQAVAQSQVNQASSPWSISVPKVVLIVLGLLFIAAGIFSFDKTRELVVSAGKKAGMAAAAA